MDYTALRNAANNITSAAANLAEAVAKVNTWQDAQQAQLDELAGQISLANESVSGSVLSLNGMLQPTPSAEGKAAQPLKVQGSGIETLVLDHAT